MGINQQPALAKGLLDYRRSLEEQLVTLRAEVARVEGELAAIDRLVSGPERVLSGDSLRAELHRILKEIDPERVGVHYQDLNRELRTRGFLVSGKSADKAPNVRAHLNYGPKAAAMFQPVGKNEGKYTWR